MPCLGYKQYLGASASCLKVFYCYFCLEVSLLGNQGNGMGWVEEGGRRTTAGKQRGEPVYLGSEGSTNEEYAQERGNEGLDI